MIYLDNNATTRVLPEVLASMLPYFGDVYFNPSSPVGAIHQADKPLNEARQHLSLLLNCALDEISLTSGATEANNWVLQSVAHRAIRETGACHLVVSAIEHPSVLEVARFLEENHAGIKVDYAPVTSDGVIDLDVFTALLKRDTVAVSIMLANNETGVIQPLAKAAELVRNLSPGCIFHTDATQAVGKITVDLAEELSNVDCLSLSAHKFHGPKGIGALFIRDGTKLDPWLHGGGQQRGMRAGTENPALAAGIAKAAQIACLHLDSQRVASMRDSLETALGDLDTTILGGEVPRLPNTSLLLFERLDAEMLIHQLLDAGFVTSTGSACSWGSDRPSHVVLAMGVDYSCAGGALRVSLSHETTSEEIQEISKALHSLIQEIS